jgi:Protein of unknown function (DUF2752)
VVPVHVALVRAGAEARLRNALLLAGLVLWMVYTRVYWSVHAMHLGLPACPFLTITGHPCPFCGGTRSFAYMWNGRVGSAVQLYPLGPLMFVVTALAIPLLAAAVLADRDLVVRLPERIRRPLRGCAAGALVVSWALKLTVLPN